MAQWIGLANLLVGVVVILSAAQSGIPFGGRLIIVGLGSWFMVCGAVLRWGS